MTQSLAAKERVSQPSLQNQIDLRWIQEPLTKLGKNLAKGHNLSQRDWLDNILVFAINVYLLVELYGHLRSTASLTHFK